jgi:hypothetical protein
MAYNKTMIIPPLNHKKFPKKAVMKIFLVLLSSLLLINNCSAQILKSLRKKIKDDTEWSVRNKANQQINKGLDSLVELPKKLKDKKKSTSSTPATTTEKTTGDNRSGNNNGQIPPASLKAGGPADNMEPQDGFITLKLSADKVFTGGSVLISGKSIMYKSYKQVEIKIAGPSPTIVSKVTLNNDGSYNLGWNASDKTGEYTVTVTGSDKKSTQSAKISVEEIDIIFDDSWPADNIKETKRALDKLEDAVDKAEDNISPKNKAELDAKMDELRERVSEVFKLYKDLGKANKEMVQLAKKEKKFSPNLSANLSELNDLLVNQASQMKQVNDIADHKPQDNTICEYLVMVNEACAAFSTFTNVFSKSIGTIIKNITLDKAVPKVTGTINEAAGGYPGPSDFVLKEATKVYATSKFDAKSLTEKMGRAGLAGDVLQFATDVLLKIYCEVFAGNLTHAYTIDFRNSKGETWWNYGVDMKAAFTLRYPKKKISGTVIKMKGNLEGNATRFSFFEDIEKQDEFQQGSKGKIEVVPINTFVPLSVSFATSERDIMGFGAIARGLATPAYFNIPVDAEYDVDAKKIKLFINGAILDFSDFIATQFIFLMIGPDLIPYPKKMNFPIHKAKTTIDGVISFHNEFTVEKDAKGNESFSGKGNRHIGDKQSARETDLNFTITATKD